MVTSIVALGVSVTPQVQSYDCRNSLKLSSQGTPELVMRLG